MSKKEKPLRIEELPTPQSKSKAVDYVDVSDDQLRDTMVGWCTSQVSARKAHARARAITKDIKCEDKAVFDKLWKEECIPILQKGGFTKHAIEKRKTRLMSRLGMKTGKTQPKIKPDIARVKSTIESWIDRGLTVSEIESIILSLK